MVFSKCSNLISTLVVLFKRSAIHIHIFHYKQGKQGGTLTRNIRLVSKTKKNRQMCKATLTRFTTSATVHFNSIAIQIQFKSNSYPTADSHPLQCNHGNIQIPALVNVRLQDILIPKLLLKTLAYTEYVGGGWGDRARE